MRTGAFLLLLLLTCISGVGAQSPADSAAIRQTTLDYLHGWYSGDVGRMGQAIHSELVKRTVQPGTDGRGVVRQQGASHLLDSTRSGGGGAIALADRRFDVRILDVAGDMASVRADGYNWVDYLQIARIGGAWRIVNILWSLNTP